jgi:hypothetical protein
MVAVVFLVLLPSTVFPADSVVVGGIKWQHLSSTQRDLPAPNIGRQVAALIQDIDSDGVNDFVIASYEKMVWYRYDRFQKKWTKYWIEKGMPTGSLEAGGDFFDIDGDGHPDLVMGAAYGGKGCLWWWKNPGPNFDPNVPWKRYLVTQVGGQHHDQVFGDFDGDDKTELAFFSNGDHKLYLARIPGNPTTRWSCTEIATLPRPGGHPESLVKADLNGDGKPEIIGGGWWFEHAGGLTFKAHPINPQRQCTRCAVGHFLKSDRPQVILNSGEDVGPLELYRWNGTSWSATRLIDRMDHGHTLQVGDIDGDGCLDILAGEMHTPGPGARCKTYLLFGDGRGHFRRELLSTGIGCHESKLGDLNGDGRLDILQKDFQHERRVDLWLNQGWKSKERTPRRSVNHLILSS